MNPEALHRPVGPRNAPVTHVPHDVMGGLGMQRSEVPEGVVRRLGLRDLPVRVRLGRVDDVGELDAVLDEEHRHVVAHQVEGALTGVELHREPACVPDRVRGAPRAQHGREPDKNLGLLPFAGQEASFRHRTAGAVGLEDTVRRSAPGMDDPLGNALVIEVGDLLPEVEVLQQSRPALAGLQRMISVGQPQALRRSEKLTGRVLPGTGRSGGRRGAVRVFAVMAR